MSISPTVHRFCERWFHDTILEVSEPTLEVASASTEIAAASDGIAQGLEEQSAQVTQISSAVEEMNASIVEVAQKSENAAGQAGASGKVVAKIVEDMQMIKQAVTETATVVEKLGEQGKQIGQIIEVINDIADQTNLLALNTAAPNRWNAGWGVPMKPVKVCRRSSPKHSMWQR
jgi:methyl-accepting chemotaxis protein